MYDKTEPESVKNAWSKPQTEGFWVGGEKRTVGKEATKRLRQCFPSGKAFRRTLEVPTHSKSKVRSSYVRVRD